MRILDPSTGSTIREIEADGPEAVAGKYARARATQPAWAATPLDERLRAISRFRELIIERTPELAETTTREVGKPIAQSRRELEGLLGRIDFFVEHVAAEVADEVVLAESGLEERIAHEPLGVVANVSAWNYPYFVGANVFLPALLTGNTVLYKPSEYATLTGLALERAVHDAGVPKDAFIAVVGDGATGGALVSQSVDGVFFTGSRATGERIAESVAKRLIPLQLELGGKDPVYVADDVDAGSAAASIADGAFYNTGQSCCAVERVYVHAKIWDEFVDRFIREVKALVVGDPMDEATSIGPLARGDAQISVLEAQVADARAKGARVVLGGARAARAGSYYEPTVLVDVTHEMNVMRDESFGPIIGLMRVKSDEEARALMDDTEYGLTASVFTKDRARAERILRTLAVGSAYFNACDRVSPRLPWSGRRGSGLGCTLSTYGIEAFMRPKAWHLRA